MARRNINARKPSTVKIVRKRSRIGHYIPYYEIKTNIPASFFFKKKYVCFVYGKWCHIMDLFVTIFNPKCSTYLRTYNSWKQSMHWTFSRILLSPLNRYRIIFCANSPELIKNENDALFVWKQFPSKLFRDTIVKQLKIHRKHAWKLEELLKHCFFKMASESLFAVHFFWNKFPLSSQSRFKNIMWTYLFKIFLKKIWKLISK